MLVRDIEPFVRQGLISDLTGSHYLARPLKTRDHRLFYIQSGDGEMLVAGERFPLKPGTLILFQSGTEYVWNSRGVRYISINFDYTRDFCEVTRTFSPLSAEDFREGDAFEKISFEDAEELSRPIGIYDAFSIGERLSRLVVEMKIRNVFQEEFLSSWLRFMIFDILRKYNQQRTVVDKKVRVTREVIAYIQSHFRERIDNESIAAYFHFDSAYLNRLFRINTGMSLHRFLVDYRLKVAMELLSSRSMPVSEVAYATGFHDVPHFIKTFKRNIGYTPGSVAR